MKCENCQNKCDNFLHDVYRKIRTHCTAVIIIILILFLVVLNITTTALLHSKGFYNLEKQYLTQSTGNNSQAEGAQIGNATLDRGSSGFDISRPLLFAYGHDFGPYIYSDSDGNQQGFIKDLMEKVCHELDVVCKVVYDKPSHCWETEAGRQPSLGIGLLAQYYDGCLGLQQTADRKKSAIFSEPFTERFPGYLWVNNDSNFSADDFSDVKVGFLGSSAEDEGCLSQKSKSTGLPLSMNQIVYAPDISALRLLLQDGIVHTVFGSGVTLASWDTDPGLKTVAGIELYCSIEGLSLMTRADSDIPRRWNTAFNQLLDTGAYQALCESSQTTHSAKGKILCIK